MKFLRYFLILIFILSAAVQINDPDPIVWIAAYLIPAYLCFYKLNKQGNSLQFFLMGLLYLIWAVNQFPPEWEGVNFENMRMKTINVELGRESLGLGMCALGVWSCMINLKRV